MSKRKYSRDECVEIDAECIRQTPEAILVVVDGDQYWIPQSLIHVDSEVYELDGRGSLIIPEWFAIQRGLV